MLLNQVPIDLDAKFECLSELRKRSQNGFFLLLLALGWWGVGASDQGTSELLRWDEDKKTIPELILVVSTLANFISFSGCVHQVMVNSPTLTLAVTPSIHPIPTL